MRIAELYARPKPTISFEFFPPKTEADEQTLYNETMPALQKLGPSFISVTYGAGGSTRGQTLRIVNRIRTQFGMEAMSHLTCVGSTREMLGAVLDEAKELGIENILALRGDPPKGESTFRATPGGFNHAVDLVRFVKDRSHFGVGAACYPEGHIECGDKVLDWDRTVAKVEAGADFLISQLFYDAEDFLRFEDHLRNKRGVKVPIIPGVLPFLTAAQIKRFTGLCGAKLSPALLARLETLAHDDESVRKLGVDICTEICRKLLDHGVAGIHIYSLNRTKSATELVRNLELAD